MKRTIILAVLIAAAFSASADSIVRCKSVDGKKTFFGERCPQGHVYTSSTYTRSVQEIDRDNRIAYEQYKREYAAQVAEYNRQVAAQNQQRAIQQEVARQVAAQTPVMPIQTSPLPSNNSYDSQQAINARNDATARSIEASRPRVCNPNGIGGFVCN
jgi:ribosomal 50S subunit-recycling heat shock protein